MTEFNPNACVVYRYSVTVYTPARERCFLWVQRSGSHRKPRGSNARPRLMRSVCIAERVTGHTAGVWLQRYSCVRTLISYKDYTIINGKGLPFSANFTICWPGI